MSSWARPGLLKKPAPKGTPAHVAAPPVATGTTRAPVKPNPTASKPKPKVPVAQGRVARLLANAGERSKLPDSYLPAAQLAQRQLNKRLAQPVTPGSSMTQRDLARQTQAAADVKYGAATQQAQQNVTQLGQVQRDTSDWYDAYLRELAAHQANVAGFQQQAQQSVAGLSQAAGALPAHGAATGLSGENQATALQASAVRKALTDSFGAMLTSQGANANTYADALAHVVGPGAKVQALDVAAGNQGKARQQLQQLVAERGAFRQTLADQTKQDEAKNVLATSIATGKELAATSEAKAAVAGATAEATTAAKYGYSLKDWRKIGPTARQAVIKSTKSTAADHVYSSGPFAGHMKSEIDAMSGVDRQKLVTAYKGTDKTSATVKRANPAARGRLRDDVASATIYAQALKDQGTPRPKAIKALLMGIPKSKDNPTSVPRFKHLVAIVALDKAYYGVVTPATVAQLLARGYTAQDVGIAAAATPAPEHP